MKKYLKDLFRTFSIIIISIILSIGSLYVFASIGWPGSIPNGEINGGLFQDNFNKIFQECGDGEFLKGFDIDKNPICFKPNP